MADNLVGRYITVLPVGKSGKDVGMLINNSTVGKLRGATDEIPGYICFNFVSKQTGETHTHPWLRVPSLREGLVGKLVGGALLSRENELHEGDMYMLWDGFNHENKTVLCAAFKTNASNKLDHEKLTVYIQYEQDPEYP